MTSAISLHVRACDLAEALRLTGCGFVRIGCRSLPLFHGGYVDEVEPTPTVRIQFEATVRDLEAKVASLPGCIIESHDIGGLSTCYARYGTARRASLVCNGELLVAHRGEPDWTLTACPTAYAQADGVGRIALWLSGVIADPLSPAKTTKAQAAGAAKATKKKKKGRAPTAATTGRKLKLPE